MRISRKQQGMYRPLVARAWEAHAERQGRPLNGRMAKEEWYRCTLLDAIGVYTTKEANGTTDFEILMLTFWEIVGDSKQISYWSGAVERRWKYLIDQRLKKLNFVPHSHEANSYIHGIAHHMHIDLLPYKDMPAEHLQKVFIALDAQFKRHRHDRELETK